MKSKFAKGFVAALLLTGMSACATQETLYSWNGYNAELLSYYKNPSELNLFAERLLEDIEAAEIDGRIPPGLYAEYGYAMLELGDARTAVVFFGKERDMWPEAVFLMTAVISRLGPIDDGDAADETDEADMPATETPAEAGGGEGGLL